MSFSAKAAEIRRTPGRWRDLFRPGDGGKLAVRLAKLGVFDFRLAACDVLSGGLHTHEKRK
jgi:hypothetical protein